MTPTQGIILYQTEDGRTRIQCRLENETIRLTQALIAELYQVTVPTANEHLKGIYAESELATGPTIRKFRIVRSEGTREVVRDIEHYNLDVILAVGFRVRSYFRGSCRWVKWRMHFCANTAEMHSRQLCKSGACSSTWSGRTRQRRPPTYRKRFSSSAAGAYCWTPISQLSTALLPRRSTRRCGEISAGFRKTS
jgi:Virulence protein RhuM family